MLETDAVFAGSIPENYDRYMVPLIFEPFAVNLAQRAASLSPSAVLEIAAGTGVVTRALAPKLSPDASYIVTDLNQPMLDYAASRQAPQGRGVVRHRRGFLCRAHLHFDHRPRAATVHSRIAISRSDDPGHERGIFRRWHDGGVDRQAQPDSGSAGTGSHGVILL